MLHEQRTGVYYNNTVTKLLHFTAFTLLCLACVKSDNGKNVRPNSISKSKSPSHNLRNKNDKINVRIVTFIFNNGWENRFSGFAELDLSFFSL